MLRELAAKAKTINIKQLAQLVVKTNAELIVDNVREQLTKGISGSGAAVGIYSSLRYATMKSRISKAPYGIVDLKLSGALQAELFPEVTNTTVKVDSTVDYSKYQISRYGDKIYDNTKKNSEEVSNINSARAVKEYAKVLGL